MPNSLWKQTLAPSLALFASTGTLICCALPALFVTLGLGAVLGGLVSAVPQLIWLSAHKVPLFWIAGALLLLAGALQWRARSMPCPVDPALARACTRYRRMSAWIYAIAVITYAIGFFFAFLAADLLL